MRGMWLGRLRSLAEAREHDRTIFRGAMEWRLRQMSLVVVLDVSADKMPPPITCMANPHRIILHRHVFVTTMILEVRLVGLHTQPRSLWVLPSEKNQACLSLPQGSVRQPFA